MPMRTTSIRSGSPTGCHEPGLKVVIYFHELLFLPNDCGAMSGGRLTPVAAAAIFLIASGMTGQPGTT